MTNGEKIKVLLKPRKDQIKIYGNWVEIEIQRLGIDFSCTLDWWNAEYEEPTTKNDLGVDCISRQAAIDVIYNNEYKKDMRKELEQLPPVTPKEKTGHWIDDEFGSKCSCCSIHTHLDKFDRPMKFKYCSMCGAKMVEPQESEVEE